MDELIAASEAADVTVGAGIVDLILQADPVVQTVMLVLLAASIWCWAVILEKGIRLARLGRKADRFEAGFWSGRLARRR
jgi:biopolymer transport protein TolQ